MLGYLINEGFKNTFKNKKSTFVNIKSIFFIYLLKIIDI